MTFGKVVFWIFRLVGWALAIGGILAKGFHYEIEILSMYADENYKFLMMSGFAFEMMFQNYCLKQEVERLKS